MRLVLGRVWNVHTCPLSDWFVMVAAIGGESTLNYSVRIRPIPLQDRASKSPPLLTTVEYCRLWTANMDTRKTRKETEGCEAVKLWKQCGCDSLNSVSAGASWSLPDAHPQRYRSSPTYRQSRPSFTNGSIFFPLRFHLSLAPCSGVERT